MSENNKKLIGANFRVKIKHKKYGYKDVFIDINDHNDNKQDITLKNKKFQKRGVKYFLDCLEKERIDIRMPGINDAIVKLCKEYTKTENPDIISILEIQNAYKKCAKKFNIDNNIYIKTTELRMELPLMIKQNKGLIKSKIYAFKKEIENIKDNDDICKEANLEENFDLINNDLKELGCEQITIQR